MFDWEVAVAKFTEQWKDASEIEAAILTGSYATGNQDIKSDIDVYLVSSNKVDWRERGTVRVNGFLVEYFVNPERQIYGYMDDGLKHGNRVDASIFTNGKTLFDKTGVLARLKQRAKHDIDQPIERLDGISQEFAKYAIWDFFEELERAHLAGDRDFHYLYFLFLEKLVETYAKFLQVVLPSRYKVYRFMKNTDYAERYGLKKIDDLIFAKMFTGCVEPKASEEAFQEILALKNYVLAQMGGFQIDGWKIRTPTEI